MKHRTATTVALASLVALTSACSAAGSAREPLPIGASPPSPSASVEITADPAPEPSTKQERIDAARDPRPRPPRQPQPSSRDLWRLTFDSEWFDLGEEKQADICEAWRLHGNAKAHELLVVPDTISAYEVGTRLEDELCLDHPG